MRTSGSAQRRRPSDRPRKRPVLRPLFGIVVALLVPDILRGDGASERWRLFLPISTPQVDQTPHPAVVRVIVDEGRSLSNGSGSFVGAREQYGLVVTNWHVVRNAKGPIQVVFPDGFRSEATTLKSDPDWDLAALLIWRPQVPPLTIGSIAPQPGDPLTIAGYGQGDYRAVMGRCTQYLAPSMKHPYEMVELSATARKGDSGGPILNDRGELAGVLFGADRGSTSGSYCGRVRWFLTSVWPELDSPHNSTPGTPPLAGDTPLALGGMLPPLTPDAGSLSAPHDTTTLSAGSSNLVPIPVADPPPEPPPAAPGPPLNVPENTMPVPDDLPADNAPVWSPYPYPSLPPLSPSTDSSSWNLLMGKTRWDHAKSILAAIGLLAVWGHLARWFSR